MSLFIDLVGNKPVDMGCLKCNQRFNTTLKYFVDFEKLLYCPHCGERINTVLGLKSLYVLQSIEQGCNEIEKMIKDMGTIKIN
jgi:Zn finger protein HypA/HybF involved in hydrogenase expression